MAKKDIIQELNGLNSSLDGTISQPVYAVPEGYFDGFAAQVLNRIKAINAANASEELVYLSPALSKLSKKLPYTAPQGYFDGLADSLLNNVNTQEDFQTVDEELESLSPLLSSIGKKIPFSIPQGYFENFRVDVASGEKQQAKVIQMHAGAGGRKWLRYAAAAVVVGIIAVGAMLFIRPAKTVDVSNTHAWVEQNMKKVSTTDINSFIQQTNETNVQEQVIAAVKNNDVKEMMKDISEKDIQDFLSDTEIADDNSDNLFLN